MSLKLTMMMRMGKAHLHSPVDDLESCFFVALWSVLFNKGQEDLLTAEERIVRRDLANSQKGQVVYSLSLLAPYEELSNIMQRFLPTLMAWWKRAWRRSEVWIGDVLENAPEGAGEEYYLPHFHCSALQGVVDILEVMSERWDGELDWESWTAPTLSATSC